MQETLLIVAVTFQAIKALINYPASFHLDLPTAVKCGSHHTQYHSHFNMLKCWFLCNKNATPILYVKVKVKVKQPLYRPWGFQDFETPRFRDNRHRKVVSLSFLRTGSPENIPGIRFR